ncbi:protein of unknown function [Pararobbsia alpina]
MEFPSHEAAYNPNAVERVAIALACFGEPSTSPPVSSAYFESTVTTALSRNDLAAFSLGYPQIYAPHLWVTGYLLTGQFEKAFHK